MQNKTAILTKHIHSNIRLKAQRGSFALVARITAGVTSADRHGGTLFVISKGPVIYQKTGARGDFTAGWCVPGDIDWTADDIDLTRKCGSCHGFDIFNARHLDT